jgi:hypothetical protein
MFLLVLAAVMMFWLVVGAVQFLICLTVPRLRKYALSAALWWAMWGPCSMALIMLAGLVVVGDSIARERGGWHLPPFPVGLGWGYLAVGVVVTVAAATVAAWVHQVVVRRFTFALFRLYAMAVVAGIGSVFGWLLSWVIAAQEWRFGWPLAIAEMLALVVGFGALGYRCARSLRGEAPTRFALVSREEFDGAEVG